MPEDPDHVHFISVEQSAASDRANAMAVVPDIQYSGT